MCFQLFLTGLWAPQGNNLLYEFTSQLQAKNGRITQLL